MNRWLDMLAFVIVILCFVAAIYYIIQVGPWNNAEDIPYECIGTTNPPSPANWKHAFSP